MRYAPVTLALIVLFSVIKAPHSYAQDGNQAITMLSLCERQDPLCVGLVYGLVTMHDVFRLGRKSPLWCPPENITTEQYILIFTSLARRAPQLLNMEASLFMIDAFKYTYPCAPGAR